MVIPVMTQHYAMLQRNLRYPGVTSISMAAICWSPTGRGIASIDRIGRKQDQDRRQIALQTDDRHDQDRAARSPESRVSSRLIDSKNGTACGRPTGAQFAPLNHHAAGGADEGPRLRQRARRDCENQDTDALKGATMLGISADFGGS